AHLLNQRIIDAAKQGDWQEAINLINSEPARIDDPSLKEIAGLAHYNLGYEAAKAEKWEIAARHWRKAGEQLGSCRLAQNLALAEEALENWGDSADAWREMVRRRSRKADNPDYLDNNQVAAIWRRAAECYRKDDEVDEAITCLKTALKYAENSMELRLVITD